MLIMVGNSGETSHAPDLSEKFGNSQAVSTFEWEGGVAGCTS